MKTRFVPARFYIISAIFALAVSACASQPPASQPERPTLPPAAPEKSNAAEIANPASVFCANNGGTSEIRSAEDGSQYGVCIFDDGSECDEWAYFRGECGPGQAPDLAGPKDTAASTDTGSQTISDQQQPAVDAALQLLASDLNADPTTIRVKSVEEQDWSDACLGLAAPDEMCAQVIVPGYQVVLTASGQDYTVRTSRAGDVAKLEK